MKSQIVLFAFVLCLAVPVSMATEVGPGPVSGEWDASENPYNINGEITVPAGEFLDIHDGVEVIFQGHHKLIVNGCLEAVGTEASPILFTAANTLDGWHGIRFIGAHDDSCLEHCIIEYGQGEGAHIDDRDGWAGGVLCDSCSPSISHCTFRENSTNWLGGGIMCYSSFSVIDHCFFTGNSAYYGGAGYGYLATPTFSHCEVLKNYGEDQSGGFQFENCSTLVEHCTVSGNTSGEWCGGIGAVISGQLEVYDCTITGNTAGTSIGGWGGGIAGSAVYLTIKRNQISGNQALQNNGAGIYAYNGCSGTIEDNIIFDNHAGFGGGGIQICVNSTLDLNNNLIYGNSAGVVGGGIRVFDYASATLNGSTVSGNSSGLDAGGINCERSSSMTITDTIVWGNSATGTSDEFFIGFSSAPSTVAIDYSDVRGGPDGYVVVEPFCTLDWGEGMIEDDPLFFDPDNGDYHLCQDPCQPGVINPCVDGGDPASTIEKWTTRTDCHGDVGIEDMGFHYPFPETVTAELTCVPDEGDLPFMSQFSVTMGNALEFDRTVAGRIDVSLAGGAIHANWRTGFTNLGPGETFSTSWPQALPALSALVGSNLFELHTEDVTSPPYNQPPYLPSGATATAACTVTGEMP